MKKIIAIILSFFLATNSTFAAYIATSANSADIPEFTELSDQLLLDYLESEIYSELITDLDSENCFIENIQAVYISKEYLDEVEYNTKANIYFGYSLEEIQSSFTGSRFIFTYNTEQKKTEIKEFTKYDDSYDKALRNVAIGGGVILLCVTVSFVTAGAAPAVSLIFAASAKTATEVALSSGVISAVTSGIITGIKTKDFDEALKAAAVNGSESFMWGAFAGALTGGIKEGFALRSATSNGLTMNEVAKIQKESKYPLDVIKNFSSTAQYEVCKEAGLVPEIIDGKTALVRSIDLKYVDEFGRSNLERMKSGLAALEPATGETYQLHHIGQKMDSTLAILTESEHMKGGNNTIWHNVSKASEINRDVFKEQRKSFWKAFAELCEKGEI